MVDTIKNLWDNYRKDGMIWKYRMVLFVISNPEIVLRDDKIWEEFCKYIKDLNLYDLKIDKTTNRLMVVQTVKTNHQMIVDDNWFLK